MPDFTTDMQRSCKYMPALRRIVGEFLLGNAPADEDQQHNTDLIVLRLEAIRIACRIRRRSYFDRFRDEFTIRISRPTGAKTELSKVIEGWGDYMLYGFADESDDDLHAWTLCNLDVFRLWFNRQLRDNKGQCPGQALKNSDGTEFCVFKISDLPPEFVVAQSAANEPQPSRALLTSAHRQELL